MTLANLDGRIVERDHDRFNKIMGGMSVKATKWWFDEMKWEVILMKTRQEIQGIDLNVREAYNHSTSYVTALTLKRNNFFFRWFGLRFQCRLHHRQVWFVRQG